MSKNYLPNRGNYNDLKPFKFWCQKVLPLVYDDSLSYYELLDKVVDYLNKTMEDVTTLNDDVTAMYGAYEQLQSYVNNYFDNLDVQDEINSKLDQMAIDGSLSALINPQIPGAVSSWLAANVDPVGSAVVVDSTLTISGAAADAKVTGDNFNDLKADFDVLYQEYKAVCSGSSTTTLIDYEMHTGDTIRIKNSSTGSIQCSANSGKPGTVIQDFGTVSAGKEKNVTLNTDAPVFRIWWTRATTAGDVVTVSKLNALVPILQGDVSELHSNMSGLYRMSDLIGGTKYQYLPDISEWTVGYWDGKPTIVTNSQYKCVHLDGFKAGTYYVSNFMEWQSFVLNASSGAVTTFHALGLTTNTDGSFTVGFDFDLYITTNKTTTNSKFTNAPLPPIWRQGAFGVDGDSYTVAQDGSGDFASVVDAVNYACQFMDSKIYIGAGTWDIIDELGADYLANVDDTQRGLYLNNRVHVVCDSRAIIEANYTGDIANVKKWLSIFNSGQYGFTLENAVLIGSNIRYIVHDERDQDTDAYVNKYINCTMVFDNRNNTAWGAKQCIGGGLGQNGYIDIEGCTFKSYQSYDGTVTYHNTGASTGRSHIVMRDCYFYLYNTFRLSWYGASTEITDALVTGCYLGADIMHRAENSGATVENTSIIAWNNTINPHS